MILLRRFYREEIPSNPLLVFEGFGMVLFGVFIAYLLFPGEVSLVGVFFVALAAKDTMERVLEWNGKAIFDAKVKPIVANLQLSWMLTLLFMGAIVGFSLIGLTLPLENIDSLFEHQLKDQPHRGALDLLRFGEFPTIILNNLSVLLFFFLVALPFRESGVMLALAWNASVWGATFSLLARHWTQSGGPSLVESFARVMTACGPHMFLEALSYVFAGLAGVFLSRGLIRHKLGSKPMFSILMSCKALLLWSLALVLLAAAVETLLAPVLVGWLG